MIGGWHSVRVLGVLVVQSATATACRTDGGPAGPSASAASVAPASQTTAALTAHGDENGAAGQRPAYYKGALFTINMKELSKSAAASIIARKQSMNEIYASNDLDEEQDFISVIDALQGDGFNPLWHQNLIVFNQGFTPHQFLSVAEIEVAAAGSHPEITLVRTEEVYRCSVVGHN